MALNLRSVLEGLRDVPDEYLGRQLRSFLTWEVGKGMNVGKPVSYYLLRIKRQWDALAQQHRELKAAPRGKSQPQGMSALIQAALEAQG